MPGRSLKKHGHSPVQYPVKVMTRLQGGVIVTDAPSTRPSGPTITVESPRGSVITIEGKGGMSRSIAKGVAAGGAAACVTSLCIGKLDGDRPLNLQSGDETILTPKSPQDSLELIGFGFHEPKTQLSVSADPDIVLVPEQDLHASADVLAPSPRVSKRGKKKRKSRASKRKTTEQRKEEIASVVLESLKPRNQQRPPLHSPKKKITKKRKRRKSRKSRASKLKSKINFFDDNSKNHASTVRKNSHAYARPLAQCGSMMHRSLRTRPGPGIPLAPYNCMLDATGYTPRSRSASFASLNQSTTQV